MKSKEVSNFTHYITLARINNWRTVGYSMVMILAGLKTIPIELEEAASIDGCNSGKILRYVRLPLIKTQLMISSIVL